MASGQPLNDIISSHFTVPSPGAVNDKIRSFFDKWFAGNGSPEGVVTAAAGAIYLQMDGTTTVIWQKVSGSGNTGWAGIAVSASGLSAAMVDGTGATAATDMITLDVTGDTNLRHVVDADGAHHWGPGNAALDVTLSRSAANELLLADGDNLAVGTGTGTKIGTAATQKLGFFNKAPVVQPTGIADASGGAVIDSQARTAVNAVISALESLGLIATV